jgi:Na+/H+ antiporter NhaA
VPEPEPAVRIAVTRLPEGPGRSLRAFLRTESASAGVLLAATVVALVWANSPLSSAYGDLWSAHLSIDLAGARIDEDLRHWVSDGLMALFFYVIGLEVRREWSMGELRDRRAAAVPAIAALGGMVVPAVLYTVVNAGGRGAHGWGTVMATDIAFVLGALSLLGSRIPSGVRVFLLTLAIVDDIGAIAVIAVFYSHGLQPVWLAGAGGVVALILLARRWRDWHGPAYLVAGAALWVCVLESGVHATIAGVVLGVLTAVHPPRRAELARATAFGRGLRRAPTPARVRDATLQATRAVSPNERFQEVLHPWTSYVVVPLFALANAGVALDGDALGAAAGSAVAIGVVVGLVLGKALGISLFSLGAVRLGVGRLPAGVARRHLLGASVLAGIGFTVSLFVADLSFDDDALAQEAKLGVLVASVLAAAGGYVALRVAGPPDGGLADRPERLVPSIDVGGDHIRGRREAPATLTLYGDFACPGTRAANELVAALRERLGDELRFVYRNLPIEEAHPGAQLAAEAAQAAGAQGRYWAMYDDLMRAPGLGLAELLPRAEILGIDLDRFADDLEHRVWAASVQADVESARRSGVEGAPTFFVGERRYDGSLELDALAEALAHARNARR